MAKQIKPVDKFYRLTTKATPLSYFIPTSGSKRRPLLYWDEETGTNRVMRYSPNQRSIFEDEQDANVLREPIVFEDGQLYVPKNKPLLQEFLALHPLNGKKFEEINTEKEAADIVETLNAEVDALVACRELDIEQVENIIRTLKEQGEPLILVSHNMRQVMDLVDRIIVFRRGRIVANLNKNETDGQDVVAYNTGAKTQPEYDVEGVA